MLRRASLFALGLVLAACAPPEDDLSTETSADPIIGGVASSDSDFPSAGALLLIASFGSQQFGSMICTGTLIAPDVVLTAGHCTVDFFNGSAMTQYYFTFDLDVSGFGQQSLDLPPRSTAVSKLLAHPSFDINSEPQPGLGEWFDVGLAFLATPVTDVTPEIVADSADGALLADGLRVDIAGYGKTNPDPNTMEGGVKFHASSILHELGVKEMQIGDLMPIPQKCHGDSGGPTYLDVEDGRSPRRRLIGITSRAYDESDCYKGGVDTRADAYRGWVEQEMIAACNDGTRGAQECRSGGGLPTAGNGPPPDAGVRDTGGGGPMDTGLADNGPAPDAGEIWPDATEADDAGVGPDATGGSGDAGSSGGGGRGGGRGRDSGCGCSTGASPGSSLVSLCLLFALLGAARALMSRS
jgi:hypothetical protein